MYQAALARSEADWIVGINATRALTTKYDAQLSLGRVQTPTIQLVYHRQQEINHFKPQKYYTLSLNVNDAIFDIQTNQRFTNKEEIQNYLKIEGQSGQIEDVSIKQKSYAKPLYNLTDLQQASYRDLKWDPKKL